MDQDCHQPRFGCSARFGSGMLSLLKLSPQTPLLKQGTPVWQKGRCHVEILTALVRARTLSIGPHDWAIVYIMAESAVSGGGGGGEGRGQNNQKMGKRGGGGEKGNMGKWGKGRKRGAGEGGEMGIIVFTCSKSPMTPSRASSCLSYRLTEDLQVSHVRVVRFQQNLQMRLARLVLALGMLPPIFLKSSDMFHEENDLVPEEEVTVVPGSRQVYV